jgi:hypothetical protein
VDPLVLDELPDDERELPVVPAAPAPVPAPVAELDPDPEDALARMNPPWALLPADADPAVLPAPAPVLPEPLADWRHPVIVTVFDESPCDCLELLLPVCPLCPDPLCPEPEDGGCCAAVPTVRTAVSIVPKIN